MSNYSRRDFLARSAAAGMLAWQADRLLAADAAAAAKPADMAIARWKGPQPKDPADPQLADIATKLTQQAIEGLAGMRRFVSSGDVVWVKPNIGWDRTPEQAGNTNPQVVAALVTMCFEAGAKTVKVGDNSVQCRRQDLPVQRHRRRRQGPGRARWCSSTSNASRKRPSGASGSRPSCSIPTSSSATW